jgi:hypothetical protein
MVEAGVGIIRHGIFMAARIANSLHAACEDESVSLLFISFVSIRASAQLTLAQ